MAEISEAPPPVPSPAADSSSAEPLGDLRNSTRTNKPGSKRLILTLTVLLSFLSGLPFLLKSTEIYRSPLPFRAIKTLSNHLQSNPPLLPCRFQAVFLRSGHDSSDESHAEKLGFQISEEMRRISGGDQKCGSCGRNYSVSVAVDSGTGCVRNGNGLELDGCLWFSGALGISGLNGSDDEAVDGLLESALGQGGECPAAGGRVYSVVVMSKEDGQGVRVVVGKHRHAWIVGNVSEMEVVPTIGKIFVKFFMNGGLEEEVMGQGSGEFMPVGSDGSVVLSFSLLNANPNDWVYDWEFQKAEEFTLTPVVEALAPIANITVESQVLYHTPKSSFSYWDEKLASYVFSMQDLPFFVNSNEWHLDTSTAAAGRSKVLQLVVYVPSANECPLQLRLPNGEISMTNGFISPMWGGVIVWNPPTCLRNSHLAKSTIPHEDLEKVFQVFMGQLRLLFGLKSNNFAAELGISSILASERGFTKWELDMLFRRHACFNLLSCATSLESLSKLVQSLPRMIVMDEIGKQVKFSLEAATLAQNNASIGIYDASVVSSRQARALAEDAFFHPSIMSISYSSIEHYFAIYMPYFAPVALHVLLAAIKELKRYKQERAKYMAFIASQEK